MQKRLPFSLIALVLFVSCMGSRPAEVGRQTLTLGSDVPGHAPTHAFAVVFAGPRGDVRDPSEVSVMWNRPMRPLELAGEEGPAPVTITTAKGETPAGAWRWMGTSAVIFAPAQALPRATEYNVKVPAGTRSLDGATLAEPYEFSFSTARPEVARAEPSDNTRGLVPQTTFDLRFNQPVDPKEVERAGKLSATPDGGETKPIAFTATWPKSDTRTYVRVTPKVPLPLASMIHLDIDGTMHGMEGPLPIATPYALNVETYGPLAVTIDCSRYTPHKNCAARGSTYLQFNNPITAKDIQSHVRIEPAIAIDWKKRGDNESGMTQWVGVPGRFRPAQKYTVIVTAGIKDSHGQTLAHDQRFEVLTDDEWPSVETGLAGTVFEAQKAGARAVPIAAMNIKSYDVLTATPDEAQVVAFYGKRGAGTDQQWTNAKQIPGAKVETVAVTAAKNTYARHEVAVDGLLVPKKGHGAVVFGSKWEADAQHSGADVRIVNVTDLGIGAKISRFGSIVWITRLSDGAPQPNATVKVRDGAGDVSFTGKTDAEGLVAVPAGIFHPEQSDGTVIFAELGDDWAFKPAQEIVDPWRLGVMANPSGRLGAYGMLFTERGIYKAGETIHVKGLFRTATQRGTTTPSGSKISFTANDANGTQVFESDAQLGAFGDFSLDVPIPEAVHLGNMELHATVEGEAAGDDEWGNPVGRAYTTVDVAQYRPVEFKVEVGPDKPSYIRGDAASFAVRGDYLFGAPMGGQHVRYTVMRGAGSFTPEGAEGLLLDDEAYAWALPSSSPRAGLLSDGKGDLDQKGSFPVSAKLTMPNQRGAEVVTVEAEVEDLSRQTVAGRSSVIVHPGEFYVGMKPLADLFVDARAKIKPQLFAIDPTGKHRGGVKVHADLVKRTWHTVIEEETYGGGVHYDSTVVDSIVGGCDTVTSDHEPASCELAAPSAGYFLVRASSKDARGNTVAASMPVYATGDSELVAWSMTDAQTLEIVNNKKQYEIGDTAELLVKSPFESAEALVTVERAGVYQKSRIAVHGSMPVIPIKVTEEMRPNAYVSIELVRGRVAAPPADGADVGGPKYRIGYSQIIVNPEARRLKVAVTPAHRDAHPGDDVEADVTVLDRAGKGTRANVTFYAVDEGVLMLTGYTTPDPIPVFTRPRPLAVFSLETRDDLARILRVGGRLGEDKGGDGGGGGTARADFRSTAFFLPTLETNADGKAHVKFKLPDSLTTYRLMAVAAAADDRFGFGEGHVVTSRPLMARPELPRFLRAGDQMNAGVVINTKNVPAGDVDVTIAVEGLELGADAKKTVHVTPDAGVEVRWPIAAPHPGKAKLTFHARGMGQADDVVVSREVKIPMALEAVALYGETGDSISEKLGSLAAVRGDTGGLEVKLASTALVGLDDGVKALIDYPYGCTEQLASRVIPLVALGAVAKDYNIDLPSDLHPMIEMAIAKIAENQRGDGGFGYWPDSRKSDPWVTAYAVWALANAQKSGYFVEQESINRGDAYMRQELSQPFQGIGLRSSYGAFMVDVLASTGHADAGLNARVYAVKDSLPLFARALLAHAMELTARQSDNTSSDAAKEQQEEISGLMKEVDNHLRVTPTGAIVTDNFGDKYAELLDSDTRTTAMVLRSLVTIDPNHPLIGRITRGLLGERRGGSWRSTQENAWALVAIDDYRRAIEAKPPEFKATVLLGDANVFRADFFGKSVRAQGAEIPMGTVLGTNGKEQPLTFNIDGSGKLFYEARLRYAKKELPTDGIDRGFYVKRVVRSVKPEALADAMKTIPLSSMTWANASDLVLVDLVVVTADPREQVVVDDPLPAGLEPVQTDLATTARSLAVTDYGGEGDENDESASDDDAVANARAWGYSWYHREFRDDRVVTFVDHMAAGMYHYRYLARATTAGTFVLPPTKAECMYEPEIFGRTGASMFEVKSP